MRKENEFGGVYHQMNFSKEELSYILDIMRWDRETLFDGESDQEYIDMSSVIISKIERELGA
jgi:hypothetical protein